MEYELFLKGGLAILEDGPQRLNIGVNDGKIAALLDPNCSASAQRTIDCTGRVILPGVLDTHSHISEQENFRCGTMTAAKGGITTVVEMPTSVVLPDILNRCLFEERVNLIQCDAVVDVSLWGGVTAKNLGALEEQMDAGCRVLKGFLSYAGETYPMLNDYQLWIAMKTIAKAGGIIGLHAENQTICAELTKKYAEENRGAAYHEKSRPVEAEREAVRRAIFFAKQTSCPLYICHISSPEVLDEIKAGREEGLIVYSETCPHYLSMDVRDLERCEGYAKCNPPLRSQESREMLWERLKAGEIDTIGSDHCCYREEEKAGSVWNASGGFPGADLLLPVLISEGIHKHGLDWKTLAKVASTNAARIFGLYPRKGHIASGADADFAVVSPDIEWTFHVKDSHYLYKLEKYPYEGKRFRGQVDMTIVRGTVVYQTGEILEKPGFGQFVAAGS